MKGKGLFIACGVVCAMALVCLIGGDYSAFGGALIVAAVLLAAALLKRRRTPQTPAQVPVAVPCETAAAEPVPSTPEPVTDGIRVITGKCGRMTVQETVSHVLFVPVKNRKILSIESDQCPCGHSFGSWNEKVHRGAAQSDRFEKAVHEPIALLDFDVDRGLAKISGSSGTEYSTDLDWCSCPDFDKRSKPCKHIYFLALQMGYSSDDFYSC